MLKQLVVAGLVLGLAACASAPPRREFGHRMRHGSHGGPPPGGMGPRRGVFISPSGEPFRGGDGLKAWFQGADADHDGTLTAEEFQADALRFFKVVDANHDGVIDGFEVSAYERTIAPEIAMLEFERLGAGRGRRGRGRAAGPAGRIALINEPEPVAGADENVDSKITLQEWKHATARRFAILDKARTGRLTLEALEGGPAGGKP